MNVRELKGYLSQYPENMEVIHDKFSDYEPIDLEDCVPQSGGWIMRSHKSMTEENKRKERMYLVIGGLR